MACCSTALSHYLDQCWLVSKGVLCHSLESNFTKVLTNLSCNMCSEIMNSKLPPNLPGTNELTTVLQENHPRCKIISTHPSAYDTVLAWRVVMRTEGEVLVPASPKPLRIVLFIISRWIYHNYRRHSPSGLVVVQCGCARGETVSQGSFAQRKQMQKLYTQWWRLRLWMAFVHGLWFWNIT